MSDKTIDKIVLSTSGTWYTNTKPSATQGLIYNEETGANIAVSYDPKHANLIAAAPDMLAELKHTARNLQSMVNFFPVDRAHSQEIEYQILVTWLRRTNDTIAKAEQE